MSVSVRTQRYSSFRGGVANRRSIPVCCSVAPALLDLSPEIEVEALRVRVLSRVEVEAGGAEGADAVISIRGATESVERNLVIALTQATRGESARLLKLSFDDIGMERYGHFLGPTMQQVTDAIEFGRHVIRRRWVF